MSGSTIIDELDTIERDRPLKSPTLTPLNAMIGWPSAFGPAALKFSAWRPHRVSRTDMPVLSTRVSSLLVIWNAGERESTVGYYTPHQS